MEGWIKLHRRFLKWEWFNDPVMVKVFIYFLLKANHDPVKWRGIRIERGQFISSHNTLCYDLNLKMQPIRTALKRLKSTGELTVKSTSRYSLYTLENYSDFQEKDNELTSKLTSKLTNEQQASNKQATTNKNDKKEKKEKIRSKHPKLIPHEDTDFILFWKHYPRKVNKKKSAIAFAKLSTHDREQALALVTRYDFNSDLQFVAYPTTWLNSEPWLDDEQNVKNQKFTVDAEGHKTAISDTEAELLERGRNNKPLTM